MLGKGSDFESCTCTSGDIIFKLRTRVVIAGDGEAKHAGRKERKTSCKVKVTVVMKQDNTDCIEHAK